MPLVACSPADLVTLLFRSHPTGVAVGTCPRPDPPSAEAVAAIKAADPDYLVKLEKLYEQLDACNGG